MTEPVSLFGAMRDALSNVVRDRVAEDVRQIIAAAAVDLSSNVAHLLSVMPGEIFVDEIVRRSSDAYQRLCPWHDATEDLHMLRSIICAALSGQPIAAAVVAAAGGVRDV